MEIPNPKNVVFELPVGFQDPPGNRYRRGWMRPALVRDEIDALKDFRTFLNPDTILLLLVSRVVVFEPSLRVTPSLLENFPAADLRYLESLYRKLNGYPEE